MPCWVLPFSEMLPHMLNRVEFRAIWRLRYQSDVFWNFELFDTCHPARSISIITKKSLKSSATSCRNRLIISVFA